MIPYKTDFAMAESVFLYGKTLSLTAHEISCYSIT